MPVPEGSLEGFSQTFGPHPSRSVGERLDPGVVPDRAVDTHCCFCGQQCGITLLVKDETVIGFEPRYNFPFNQGKLCPKGVKCYLQGAHPDRLLHAYERDTASPAGFRAMPYDLAIERVAAAIDRIQSEHGPQAFAVLTGASLTIEKA
jgi:assimilatory nitrate reductase catalytic subunit